MTNESICRAWAPVNGFIGFYEVSSDGLVRSLDRIDKRGYRIKGRQLKLKLDAYGYHIVALYGIDKKRDAKVHHLVLEAFVGLRPDATYEACHGDGVKTNNDVSNLRWDTRIANQADRWLHGAMRFGESHQNAKLTDEQVKSIKSLQLSQSRIALMYGVSQSHISRIKNGKQRSTQQQMTAPT